LNSLYINQKGREGEGIVNPGAEKETLIREIIHNLESFQDPETGVKPVLRAFAATDVYSGAHMDKAPDIIIGYNQGYRVSWSSPLGRVPKNIVEDNNEKWSGDHCMAPEVVPGILVTNQKTKVDSPSLSDIAPTILQTFGIEKTKEMVGKSVF
jgi:predicted AlkP superfamily phosphohydrolase/phosphomutase